MSPPSHPTPARVLVLARHGKAEPFSVEDQRRQLTDRGRREAAEAGRWLADHHVVPSAAIVSSAVRTRQTWEHLAQGCGASILADFADAAYGADAEGAVELLRHAPSDSRVLAFVGHNPTVSSLVHLLDDGEPDASAFRMLSFGLPTSGVAVLEVTTSWADLAPGSARLVAGHTP